ncbi:hypothetical protein V8F06_001708 [Rhypophila decipiens]
MDRRPTFEYLPQDPQSPGTHYRYYNHQHPPPELRDRRWSEAHRLSHPHLFDDRPPPYYSPYWLPGFGMTTRYLLPEYNEVHRHPGHGPHQTPYDPQYPPPSPRQARHQAPAVYFRDPFAEADQGHENGGRGCHPQDQHDDVPDQRGENACGYESLGHSMLSPRSYRSTPPGDRQFAEHGRMTSSSTHEFNSDSGESLAGLSDSTDGKPSLGSSSIRCELCDQVGHLGYNCRLSRWDESASETSRAPSPDEETPNEDQEKYQKLAGKLSHICWNLIPDSDQPPESHKTMMKHILHVLSQHQDNTETVYNHMFGEEFQHKWLCLKAMCDPEWQGAVWLIDGACRYCNHPSRADPVTLCYQILPSREEMATYREVGIVRA